MIECSNQLEKGGKLFFSKIKKSSQIGGVGGVDTKGHRKAPKIDLTFFVRQKLQRHFT